MEKFIINDNDDIDARQDSIKDILKNQIIQKDRIENSQIHEFNEVIVDNLKDSEKEILKKKEFLKKLRGKTLKELSEKKSIKNLEIKDLIEMGNNQENLGTKDKINLENEIIMIMENIIVSESIHNKLKFNEYSLMICSFLSIFSAILGYEKYYGDKSTVKYSDLTKDENRMLLFTTIFNSVSTVLMCKLLI